MNDTLLYALALIPALVIAIVFHEVAHGWVALMLGDPTAKEQRRLTLNPIRHVDPIGTILVPGGLMLAGLPAFGWAKPVPVIQSRLRNPRFGMMAVAAAGPATNLLLAALAALVLGVLTRGVEAEVSGLAEFGLLSLYLFILINIFLALFNLLPIPPFDGSHIVEGALPRNAAAVYRKLQPFGFILLFLLLLVVPFFFPELRIVERIVGPPAEWVEQQFVALAKWAAGE